MTVHLHLLTVSCFVVIEISAQTFYLNNGWRPMSIEKVLQQQRGFIKTSNDHFKSSPKLPMVANDMENINFVKIIQTNELTENLAEVDKVVPVSERYEEDSSEYKELIKIIQPPHREIITHDDTNTYFYDVKQNQQLRKAKKIEDYNGTIHFNIPISDQMKTKEEQEKADEKHIEKGLVKKIIDEENQSASNQKVHYTKGYQHVIQKSTGVETNSNLTAKLLDILANYNIRTSDNLRNYDISLRQNSRSSPNSGVSFVHIPIKAPIKYNNANHLLVDPVLAVFLSNYGYYLPSLFGYNGGYNNLYGYLASNNIHNNRPFGSYKIFSDTDSFH